MTTFLSAARERAPEPPAAARFSYEEAFSRNIGLVSAEEQQRLRAARVAIAGLGGVGGAHALALARLGVGRFALADFDTFEVANFNRQVGATVVSLNRPKVEVMAEAILAVNPTADLRLFPAGVDGSNIDEFLDGSVAAVDGVDFFNMDARRLLFRQARQRGVPALTAAPIGFGATLHVFMPDGMSFDDYFDIRPGMSLPEQLVQFGLGLAPRLAHLKYFPPSALDLSGRRAPSLGSACLLAAVLVCTEIANLVLRRRPARAAPYFFQFDPLVQTYKKGRLRWGNRHPLQRLKRWWVLRTSPALRAAIEAARS
jgi:molybdopterin/thiamine biosynthesis adenylyltransferase